MFKPVQIGMCFFVTISSNLAIDASLMHEGVDESSLHKICKYQQKVPQHYYLFDILVAHIDCLKWFLFSSMIETNFYDEQTVKPQSILDYPDSLGLDKIVRPDQSRVRLINYYI